VAEVMTGVRLDNGPEKFGPGGFDFRWIGT